VVGVALRVAVAAVEEEVGGGLEGQAAEVLVASALVGEDVAIGVRSVVTIDGGTVVGGVEEEVVAHQRAA
jgi:hypothetical protein